MQRTNPAYPKKGMGDNPTTNRAYDLGDDSLKGRLSFGAKSAPTTLK